ncbi:MAG: hypothetical protein HYX44_00075 [Aquabacterium sp.]|nr:hypothetical protein [Aquabacterium sp.]
MPRRKPVISWSMYPQWVTQLGQAWVKGATDLLAHNKLPLSGDVSQWIRTWGEAVGQIGLLNINTVNSGNPSLERDIGSQYSYGRQLGRILDVLTPLVEADKATVIKQPDGADKLEGYESMVKRIQELKGKKAPTREDIVRDVHRLASQLSQDERQQLWQELSKAVSGEPAVPRLTA